VEVQDGAWIILESCTLTENKANDTGGAGIWAGGGGGMSGRTLYAENCLIVGNEAPSGGGGGIRLEQPGMGWPSAVVVNSTICDNTCGGSFGGGGIFESSGDLAVWIYNCIIRGNECPTINYVGPGSEGRGEQIGADGRVPYAQFRHCNVEQQNVVNVPQNVACIDEEAWFRDASAGDYRLAGGSPCVDSGTADLSETGGGDSLPSGDRTGGTRVQDGDGDGTATVDMGVHEYVAGSTDPEIALSQGGTDLPDGTGTYDFGGEQIGNDGSATFTITNSGDAVLTVNSTVEITGTHAADFSVTQEPGTAVGPGGGETTFDLTFAPGGVGPRAATVTVTNSDADEGTYDFTVTGEGTFLPATLIKGKLACAFSKPNKDSLKIAGLYPPGEDPVLTDGSGGTFRIGSYERDFTMTAKGKCVKDAFLKVGIKAKSRAVSVALKKVDLAAALGIADQEVPKPGTPIELTWTLSLDNGWTIGGTATFQWTAKAGKKGKGVLVP
jgi:hypothetical protein